MAASFNKYNCFVADLANNVHNLGSNVLKIALTNTAPVVTDTAWSTGTYPPPTQANGYTSGGYTVTIDSSTQTSGLYTLASTSAIVVTATTGGIGPFRYCILYNSTSAGKQVIGWWDYGTSFTLAASETFTITPSGSILTLQ
jgi:hypothetical protein